MHLSRRDAIALGTAATALALAPGATLAQSPAAETADALIAAFNGGTRPEPGALRLEAPDLAENGNAVPVALHAPGAVAVLLVAPENPLPKVLEWRPGAGAAGRLATRIRMAATQDLIALARLPDGRIEEARVRVQVTVGGCVG